MGTNMLVDIDIRHHRREADESRDTGQHYGPKRTLPA